MQPRLEYSQGYQHPSFQPNDPAEARHDLWPMLLTVLMFVGGIGLFDAEPPQPGQVQAKITGLPDGPFKSELQEVFDRCCQL